MVLPLIIGGGLALLGGAGVVGWKIFKTVDDIRHDAKDFGNVAAAAVNDIRCDAFNITKRLVRTVDHVAFNLTENITTFNHGCLASIGMLSRRIDVSVRLLTNAIVAFLTTCSLSLLLYLTEYSPFLRTVVWFLFVSLCFQMVCNYVIQSTLVEPSQQQGPSVQPTLNRKKLIKGEKNIIDLFPIENKTVKRAFSIECLTKY